MSSEILNHLDYYLAWVTHNRPHCLQKSLGSVFGADTCKPKILISNSGDPISDIINLHGTEKNIEIFEGDVRNEWLIKFKLACAKRSINPSLIDFALAAASNKNSKDWVTTGSNRNFLLLKLIGKKFISFDDDTLFQVHENFPGGLTQVIISGSCTNPFVTKFFSDAEECKSFVYSSIPEVSLQAFIGSHLKLLHSKGVDGSSCALSMTGYFGDSGFNSPRFIFGLEDNLLIQLLSSPNNLNAAISNRHIVRVSEEVKKLKISQFMPICAGFSNDLNLPPFFPIGRNQDGAYAYALAGTLGNTHIGHLNMAIQHHPLEQRIYGESLLTLSIRINDLISFLWIELLKKHREVNYQIAAKHFIDFSSDSDNIFFSKMTTLISENLQQRSKRIKSQISRMDLANISNRQQWSVLAQHEASLCEKLATEKESLIPIEAAVVTSNPVCASALVRDWINHYGNLLKSWEDIRDCAYNFSL